LARRIIGNTEEITVLDGCVENAEQIPRLGGSFDRCYRSFDRSFNWRVQCLFLFPLLQCQFGRRKFSVEVPDLGSMICGAGCKVLDIGREENTSEVVLMSLEGTDGNDAGGVVGLNHAPQVHIALSTISKEPCNAP
jgi:hypothetical protein